MNERMYGVVRCSPPAVKKIPFLASCIMPDRFSTIAVLSASNVIAGMRRAFQESDVRGPNPIEQGGFIVQTRDTGELEVERLSEGGRDSLSYPICADGTYNGKRIVGTFHTHPNTGWDWTQEPSPQDIRLSADYPETMGPHQFVIGAETIYHIDNEGVVTNVGSTLELLGLDAED